MYRCSISYFIYALLIGILIILLFSTSNNYLNYEISGQVEIMEDFPHDANVYFSLSPDFPSPTERTKLHHVPTFIKGNFKTEYRAPIHSKIYLFFVKEGYLPVRYTLHTGEQSGKRQTIKQPILVAVNTEEFLEYSGLDLFLQCYSDPCGKIKSKALNFENITFLENIIPVKDQSQCEQGVFHIIEADIHTRNHIYQDVYLNERLQIVSSAPSFRSKQLANN